MNPDYGVISAIVGGLVTAGIIIGKQLGKFLAENAKNIERDLRIKSLENRMDDVEEEQRYDRRHKGT